MLLVLTHSTDATATYLCARLDVAGIPFVRLDTDTCQRAVTVRYVVGEPVLRTGRDLRPQDVHAVWLRRPRPIDVDGAGDMADRAHVANEWGAAIEGFLAHIPPERWMNHPVANVGASHKLEQLTRAARVGLQVPSTLVTQDRDELDMFRRQHGGRIVAKPLASGHIARADGSNASIYTTRVLEEHLDSTLLAACPTLFQAEIAKSTDVRVTILILSCVPSR